MHIELISKYPKETIQKAPLLFVHGAWHGAWCWDEYFLDYFTKHGFEAHALSLRGHGKSDGRERLRWTRISEYVQDVETAVNQLSQPPILIGHSMGGFIVQKYLETHTTPGSILLASVPPQGTLGITLRIAKRHPFRFAKVNLTMSLYPLIDTPKLTAESFFSPTMSDQKVAGYFDRMQDEAYLGYLDMLVFDLPKPKRIKNRMLVLGAANDKIVTVKEVEKTAQAYNAESHISPNMAHDMMLEAGWQAVADRMIRWITK